MSNILTDASGMVQTEVVRSLLNKTLRSEYGYSLEIFRNNSQIGALRTFGQSVETRRGDTIYRVNLGPQRLKVEGQLQTEDRYTRAYTVIVELQIKDISLFLEAYRQGSDPVQSVYTQVQKAIQVYADRTIYQEIEPARIQNKAIYALSMEPNEQVDGLQISDAYEALLHEDENYEAIDLAPIITIQGNLTTSEGYTRSYEIQLELEVSNAYMYRTLEASDTGPLERIQISINNTLANYAHQHFYEDLSDTQLSRIATGLISYTHTLQDQIWKCAKITRILHTTIGNDTSFVPINLNPLLTVQSMLLTREGYSRLCTLKLELQVIDRLHYRQLLHDGSDPLNLATIAIDGELLKYSRQQFYEDLSEQALRTRIEQSFRQFSSHMTGGMQLIYIHSLVLGTDATYQPFNFSPLVTCQGQVTTLEGYVRSYELVVEFFINNRRLYQELEYEGAAPLERAKVAINSELQQYARQQRYEELTEDQFITVAEHAFDRLSSRVTNDIRIVKAYNLTLGEDPEYVNLGPRTLTITGQLKTADYRQRAYELTVLLEVAQHDEFVTLTRQGNDPFKLVEVAIQGAIQRAADGKTHTEISLLNLGLAAQRAFTNAPETTIGGLKLRNADNFSIQVDTGIQEEAAIRQQTQISLTRLEQQTALTQSREKHNLGLLKIQQEIEKSKYSFEIEKSNAQETSKFQQGLAKQLADTLLERLKEDLSSGVEFTEIQTEVGILNNILQLNSAQTAIENKNQAQNYIGAQQIPHIQGPGSEQENLVLAQTSQASTPQQPVQKNVPAWGIQLIEVTLPDELRALAGQQERAFQVWEILEEMDLPFEETDILLKINKQKIYNPADLESALASLSLMQETKITVLRDGVKKILTILPLVDAQSAQDES